ncbi:NAD(P)H-dependent glycerol-3-phosphate dehydrogenase [Candidatus Uhrbacteria bacterium]|nr:NAD(P)H-dependent glycerol-3-phosphate dehydrogenase [Candidatus Uhrbacteria bacterium]
MRIAILGAGNMGIALATVLAERGQRTTLWSIEPDVVADIAHHHRSEKYLPGIALGSRITATGDLATALRGAHGVIIAVPSAVIAQVAERAASHVSKRIPVLSVAKGIAPTSFRPLADVVARALGRVHGSVAGLGGPAIATEFSRGTPTAVVVAGRYADTKFWQRALERSTFRVEASRDLMGVSWAACLKNVYAIALGMCDGMRYAMNTKAILVMRAIAEMTVVLRSVHAKRETVFGLAGVGDLVTTGFSPHGRNRRFGEMICTGEQCDIPAVLKTMTVEGVVAVDVAHTWAIRKRLGLPLLDLVWRICHRDADPCRSLETYLRK